MSDPRQGTKTPAGTFRFEILKQGRWKYGQDHLEVTANLLSEFKKNFDERKYYPVPVDGPSRGGEAHSPNDLHDCGFVKSLELSANGDSLYACVDVTSPEIAKMLDEGSLAFCSSELFMGWTEPEQEHTLNVLSGLGLTNRPFIKNMAPAQTVAVNFSEFYNTGDSPMDEKQKALEAEVILLREKAEKNALIQKELDDAKAKAIELSEKNAVYELALKDKETKSALDSVAKTIENIMVTKGAIDVPTAEAFMKLGEAIVKGGVQHITLAEGAPSADGSMYRAGATIMKCDLISMLTDALNALPGDVVHTTVSGSPNGDDADLDEDGHMDSNADNAKSAFSFSERFKAVKPKSHGSGVTQEFVLSEAKKKADKDKIGIVEAIQFVLKEHKIDSINKLGAMK